jgi:SAM-dependent methyltransferase
MNKQNAAKLKIFLSGLMSRLDENELFFKKMGIELKSGLKSYKSNITFQNKNFSYNINGKTKSFENIDFPDEIVKLVEEYDAVIFSYEERGVIYKIEGDIKGVRLKTGENLDQIKTDTHELVQNGGREYIIKTGKANKLLKEIGILAENDKIKNDMVRKYNQIDHFIELIQDIFSSTLKDVECINVLDCACGKSYLSFALNYYIKEILKRNCQFIGIDISEGVIKSSRAMAERLGYKNMEFINSDLKDYFPEKQIHLFISLHACDTATDMALALAVNIRANAIVAVPCCHREILGQFTLPNLQPLLKYGILKARFADVVTEGIRGLLLESHGYKVSMVEYISPLDTPKNLMIRAELKNDGNSKAKAEYSEIKKLLGVEPSLEKMLRNVF